MDKIREKIDAIDDEMRILFEERMDCVREIVDYKIKNQLEIRDGGREVEMIERNLKKLKNPDYQDVYTRFLKKMISDSKEFQQRWIDQNNKEKWGQR